jgi:hypothetical protein
MRTKTVSKTDGSAEVMALKTAQLHFCVLGSSPLIMNRMSEKARQELLLPAAKKNHAERAASLKHDPIAEFRGAIYRTQGDNHPTRVVMPGNAFGQALASAAIDIPGAVKAQITRLTEVTDINVNVYGLPRLYMAVVRQSDINRTPDIRTRAIFPEWAVQLSVRFVKDLLTERTVANLLAASGILIGIGDNRRQKGGLYGKYELVDADNKAFQVLIKNAGRKAQDEAIAQAIPFDADSEELFSWFVNTARDREKKITRGELRAA